MAMSAYIIVYGYAMRVRLSNCGKLSHTDVPSPRRIPTGPVPGRVKKRFFTRFFTRIYRGLSVENVAPNGPSARPWSSP